MASKTDLTAQSDVSRQKLEPDGSFKRPPSSFRDTIEKGGKFPPEKDRYHLYAAYSCPWAHRTIIIHKLKGLEDIIPRTITAPRMDEHGWPFANVDKFPLAEIDPNIGAEHVKDLYLKADPDFEGRFTLPVLWDKKQNTIVNNESSEILRIFNSSFNELLPPEKAVIDIYPKPLRPEIDGINEWVYDLFNNGVYRTGFAATQEAYEKAVYGVFEALDRLEKILDGKEFLVGDKLTEADIRLYVTAIRFDVAYHGIFKCNFRTIRANYPNVHLWLRKLYWNNPVFKSATNFDHIKAGYHSIKKLNPNGIVPVGPLPHIEFL